MGGMIPEDVAKTALSPAKSQRANRRPDKKLLTDRTEAGKEKLATYMRAFPTKSELRLWVHIMSLGLQDEFERQPVMHGYIPDFYHSGRLIGEQSGSCKPFIVEVDGSSHAGRGAKSWDARRDQVFRSHGISVIRVKNEDVMGNPGLVLAKILEARKVRAVSKKS